MSEETKPVRFNEFAPDSAKELPRESERMRPARKVVPIERPPVDSEKVE